MIAAIDTLGKYQDMIGDVRLFRLSNEDACRVTNHPLVRELDEKEKLYVQWRDHRRLCRSTVVRHFLTSWNFLPLGLEMYHELAHITIPLRKLERALQAIQDTPYRVFKYPGREYQLHHVNVDISKKAVLITGLFTRRTPGGEAGASQN